MSRVARRSDKGKGGSRGRTQYQDDGNTDVDYFSYDAFHAETSESAIGYQHRDGEYQVPSSPSNYTHISSNQSYFHVLSTSASQGDDTTPGTLASPSPHLYHGNGYEPQDEPRKSELGYDPREAEIPYHQDPQTAYNDGDGGLSVDFASLHVADTGGDTNPNSSEWAQEYEANAGEVHPYHTGNEDQVTEYETYLEASNGACYDQADDNETPEEPQCGVTLRFVSKNTKNKHRVSALLDSGNHLGPMVDLKTIKSLGFRTEDLKPPRRGYEVVGGEMKKTLGQLQLSYSYGGDSSKFESTFHVVDKVLAKYPVLLQSDSELAAPGPGVWPASVAGTVASAMRMTEEGQEEQKKKKKEQDEEGKKEDRKRKEERRKNRK